MAVGFGAAFLSYFVGLATSLFLRAYAEHLKRKELTKGLAEVEITTSWKNSAVCNCAAKSYCQLTGSWGKKRGATGSCCQLKWVVSEEMIKAASSWIYLRRCGGGGRIWTCDLRVMSPSGTVFSHLPRSTPDLWYSLVITGDIGSLFGQMCQQVSLIYP